MKVHFKTVLITTFIMFSFVAANAQIDLKKIGKKVEQKVEKKKDEVKTERQEQVKSERQEETVAKPSSSKQDNKGDKYDYKKKYKPSAAALAADPKAADQTVESGYTKSISEIHAAYEQLDPVAFPYQPYYKYKEFYYLHDEKTEQIHLGQWVETIMDIAKLPAGAPYYMAYVAIKTPGGDEVLVTYDELFRNSWTALFIADPLSTWAFHKYVNVVMFETRGFHPKYNYKMSDAQKGIVDAKSGALLFATTKNVYEHTQESRRDLALSLARTEVTIDYLRYYLNELFGQFKEETNATWKYILYFKIEGIMVDIFKRHKDYNSTDVANRKIEASFMAINEQRFDVETNAYANSAATVEMPKGVQIDAATSSKVNSMAKENLGAEYVKTIFLSNKWSEFQENKYPYRVMHLSLPVAVIVKRGDKYLINYYDVTKSPHGGAWNMMVKMGSSFQPVNYK